MPGLEGLAWDMSQSQVLIPLRENIAETATLRNLVQVTVLGIYNNSVPLLWHPYT